MKRIKYSFDKIVDFLAVDVWHNPAGADRFRIFLLQILRVFLLTISGLKKQLIFLRASALAYNTILAIVPLLAVAFSVLKGFGIPGHIESILVNLLAAGQQEVTNRIIEYISNTNFKALGALGSGFLIITVINMLGTVEKTFNYLWGITRSRSLVRKISDYISVLVISPILLVVSLTLIASLSSNTVVMKLSQYEIFNNFFVLFNSVIPLVGIWIAFTSIYILMPNTQVKFFPGVAAGIFSGTLWEIAFRLYAELNIGVAKYNAIYGTFAVFPIFLIWLYISWLILLIGAQLSCAIQNVNTYQQEMNEYEVSSGQQQYMALNIMLQIAKRFYQGQPPMTAEELSHALSIPIRLVISLSNILARQGLVQEVFTDQRLFQPAQSLHLISVLNVCEAVQNAGRVDWNFPEEKKDAGLEELLKIKETTDKEQLGEITMLDLLKNSSNMEKKD